MKTGIRAGNAYKNGYKQYKLENRSEKNKIKKLNRHCKKHPEDTQAVEALVKIKKAGYNRRTKPNAPGSNPPAKQVYFIHHPDQPKLAGEQLAALLGIPYKTPRQRSGKPTVSYRKKRNAKKVS